jgi:thiol-disulfide isomerase/thioredoxin
MNKKLVTILSAVLIIIAISTVYFKNSAVILDSKTDALKFKEEYEALNGKTSKSGKTYPTVEISDDNPIKYATTDEVLDILNNGTGIIYFGYPECPWCRSMLPTLLEVSSDYNIDTIYYLNVYGMRDSLMLDEDDNVICATDKDGNQLTGTEDYFRLLDALSDWLEEYTITCDDGDVISLGEKRIYVPLIVFVKNGKIVGTHLSTVDSQKSGYDEMTEDQREELYDIYEQYIKKASLNTCDENC